MRTTVNPFKLIVSIAVLGSCAAYFANAYYTRKTELAQNGCYTRATTTGVIPRKAKSGPYITYHFKYGNRYYNGRTNLDKTTQVLGGVYWVKFSRYNPQVNQLYNEYTPVDVEVPDSATCIYHYMAQIKVTGITDSLHVTPLVHLYYNLLNIREDEALRGIQAAMDGKTTYIKFDDIDTSAAFCRQAKAHGLKATYKVL